MWRGILHAIVRGKSLPCITLLPTESSILLHPGYPFTPFLSVLIRSKGGAFFSRGYRTCLAGSELVTNVG